MSVLCLGEILWDYLAEQPGKSLSEVTSWTPQPGGAPANVACGLVKLGTAAAFIGCVGEDAAGQDLIALLVNLGVNTAAIQSHPSAPTRKVYVTRSQAGERHFAGFGGIPTPEFADTRLDASKLPESLFSQAKYLVTGTLGLAYPQSRQAMERALELAKAYQVKVAIDLNWRSVFWEDPGSAAPLILEFLKRADMVKCSEEEACWLFNTDSPVTIARQLGVGGVLVTRGEKGCHYSFGDFSGSVAAFRVKTVDTTGAGDSFLSGFLHQCCQQGEALLQSAEILKEAIAYASAAAALTTTRLGAIAAQPPVEQVKALRKQISEDFSKVE
jgi:fructokinase